MNYWGGGGGQKVCWPPSQIIVGGGGWPPRSGSPPFPTPMKILLEIQQSGVVSWNMLLPCQLFLSGVALSPQ